MRLPHHISHEPAAGDRGHAFGVAQRDAIASTVRTYRRLLQDVDLRAAGAAVADSLDPHHVDELEGMAAGAGQDAHDLLAINARTELLAGAECSVVGQLRGSEVSLAQTWDWHPDLAPARVLWTVNLADGAWFTTATEAGILAKLGLNGYGVACALNLLGDPADGGTGGVPIHVLLRLVLERARDAAQAVELLCGAGTTASSAVTVASAGELVSVELAPGGAVLVRPDPDGWLVHTNHFLSRPVQGEDEQGSRLRRAQLLALLRAGVAPEAALASHLPSAEPVCRHGDPGVPWPDRIATLLAIRIDPAEPSFSLAAGPPCSAPFEPVPLSAAGARAPARPPAPRPRARAG